jgi:DNA-binding transcriptional ArsR family regulator
MPSTPSPSHAGARSFGSCATTSFRPEQSPHFADVSRPAISQHLRVLREAALLSERRDGTRRLYRARPEGLGDLRDFLEQFWDERLETLRVEAEREERKKRRDRGSRN